MRVTSKMSADNAIFNIARSREKIDKLNELISTQQQVNKPSDDTVAAAKILSIETQIKTTTQYITNIKNSQLWLKMQGTVLEGVQNTILLVKGVAGTAVGALDDPYKRSDMISQLKLYRDQLIDMPNTAQVGEQYIFSGYKGDQRPFDATTLTATVTSGSSSITGIDTTDMHLGMPITGGGIPDGSIVTAIPTPGVGGTITISNPATANGTSLSFTGKFQGTDDKFSVEMNQSMTVDINVTGGNLLRGTKAGDVDIIKTLDKLILDISNQDSASILVDIKNIDTSNKQIMSIIGDVGMRSARVDNLLNYQQRNDDTLRTILSDVQNVDMSKAAVELTNQKTAFEATLAATAKIAPISLLDYL